MVSATIRIAGALPPRRLLIHAQETHGLPHHSITPDSPLVSNYLVNQVKQFSQAKGLTRFVLWAIADRINDESGEWSMGYSLIAKDCGIHRVTAIEAVQTLEVMGELTITRTKLAASENFRNVYKVTVGGSSQSLPPSSEGLPGVVVSDYQGSSEGLPGVVVSDYQGSSEGLPRTQRNQIKPISPLVNQERKEKLKIFKNETVQKAYERGWVDEDYLRTAITYHSVTTDEVELWREQ